MKIGRHAEHRDETDRGPLGSGPREHAVAPILALHDRVGNSGVMRLQMKRAEAAAGGCSCGGTCSKCTSVPVQLKSEHGSAPASAGEVRSKLASGRPLDSSTRGRMEAGFGRSFEDVRVHTDATAQTMAAGLSARALTVGADIAFADGEYAPGTIGGDLLIAHELAHVAQQRAGLQGESDEIGAETPALEREADAAAVRVMTGNSATFIAHGGGLRLQRCTPATGGGILPSAFQFEEIVPSPFPWYAACVNIFVAHLGTTAANVCQFEVGFPGVHHRGRTTRAQAQAIAAEAFNECAHSLMRRRRHHLPTFCFEARECIERRMQRSIPGVRVNTPCITTTLTPTNFPEPN